jgi:uridine phosphorylase
MIKKLETHIPESELILNSDGSIYHLHLLPGDIANTIILVGDQDRVHEVSKYFDKIEIKKHKREFFTHTGYIGNKRISVLSTGIGTDNIDICMNELDALVNVDLSTREIKKNHTALNIIRIGTSGSLQSNIPVDSVVISEQGLGLDSVMHFYNRQGNIELEQSIKAQLGYDFIFPYIENGSTDLINKLNPNYIKGITTTCCGFYAPQGRFLKAKGISADLINKLSNLNIGGKKVTNFEMETAAIYGLANVLGHQAVSVNCIMANRIENVFSKNPAKTIDNTIKDVLASL